MKTLSTILLVKINVSLRQTGKNYPLNIKFILKNTKNAEILNVRALWSIKF